MKRVNEGCQTYPPCGREEWHGDSTQGGSELWPPLHARSTAPALELVLHAMPLPFPSPYPHFPHH